MKILQLCHKPPQPSIDGGCISMNNTTEGLLKNKLDKSGKKFLMLANWPSGSAKKDKNTKQVDKIIGMISELRSFKNELNVDIETLFFEGDLGSLAPNLDKAGITPIDLGFSLGRQAITFQEGILINDTVDAIGLIRNNLS